MWLFVALLAPALSALGSYTDKYLLVHHQHTGGLGSVVIFSCLFGVLVMPVALIFEADISRVSTLEAAILIFNGFLTVGTLTAYLYAIRDSDVVSVMPVLQTTPVFGFVLGFFMLGETLKLLEIIGSAIIILSAILLSLEIEEDARFRFRSRSFFLAMLSAFLFAVSGIVFKLIASEHGYWTTQFWEYVGISILGMLLIGFVTSYRHGFLQVIRNGRIDVVALNFVTEGITVSADLLLNFAVLLAPVALVYSVNSFQPAFLLILALIGSFMVPKLMHQLEFVRKHILFKAFAIMIMIFGVYIIHSA